MSDDTHYLGEATLSQHNGRVEWIFEYMDPGTREKIMDILNAMDNFTDQNNGYRLTLRVEQYDD